MISLLIRLPTTPLSLPSVVWTMYSSGRIYGYGLQILTCYSDNSPFAADAQSEVHIRKHIIPFKISPGIIYRDYTVWSWIIVVNISKFHPHHLHN